MRRIFALLALLAASGLAYAAADQAADGGGPEADVLNQALALLSRGDSAGFDPLIELMPEAQRQQFALYVKSQSLNLKEQVQQHGEPLGSDLVEIQEVGCVLRRYYYITRYKDGWIRWRFSFYRPEAQWEFVTYQFHNEEDGVFFELARSAPNQN